MTLPEMLQQVRSELGFKTEFTVVMLTMALLLARILPMLTLTPFLGGDVVPTEVKIGTGLTLGLVMYPLLAERMKFIPVSALPFVGLMIKELFIGLCFAFIVGMVFEAAQVAGTLIDAMSGTNQAQMLVPQIGQQVSLFASLKLQLVVVLFLTLNGHHLVIAAFAESLEKIPIDQFPKFGSGVWPFFDTMIRIFADLISVGVAFAAPVLLATFLTDLSLGMVNRVAPQVQVFFVSMQIKPLVTVMIMFIAIQVIMERVVDEYQGMLRLFELAVQKLS